MRFLVFLILLAICSELLILTRGRSFGCCYCGQSKLLSLRSCPKTIDSIRLQHHVLDRETMQTIHRCIVCTLKPIIEVNKRSNAQRDKWIWVVRTRKKRFMSQAILSFLAFEYLSNVRYFTFYNFASEASYVY